MQKTLNTLGFSLVQGFLRSNFTALGSFISDVICGGSSLTSSLTTTHQARSQDVVIEGFDVYVYVTLTLNPLITSFWLRACPPQLSWPVQRVKLGKHDFLVKSLNDQAKPLWTTELAYIKAVYIRAGALVQKSVPFLKMKHTITWFKSVHTG